MAKFDLEKLLDAENRFIEETGRFPPGRSMPLPMCDSRRRATQQEFYEWCDEKGIGRPWWKPEQEADDGE